MGAPNAGWSQPAANSGHLHPVDDHLLTGLPALHDASPLRTGEPQRVRAAFSARRDQPDRIDGDVGGSSSDGISNCASSRPSASEH